MLRILRSNLSWRQTFVAFSHRDFARLWAAVAVSHIGAAARDLSAGWLARQLTASPLLVSLAPAGNQLGILLFSIPAGAVADRRGRKSILLASGSVMGLALGILAALVLSEWIASWHIPLALLLFGFGAGFWGTTRRAMVPDIVGQEDLLNAIVWESMAPQATRVVVPLLIGALLALGGTGQVLVLGALMYAIAAALCLFLRIGSEATSRRSAVSMGADLKEGFRYIWTDKTVLGLMFLPAIVGVFNHAYMGLLPIFAADVHDVGAVGLGAMASATGFGTVVGGLALASVRRVRLRGRFLLAMASLSATFLILFAASPAFPVALVALALLAGTNTMVSSTSSSLLLEIVPRDLRGRVQGVHLPISVGEAPLGGLLVGALAESLGTPVALALGGGISLLLVLWVAVRFPQLRRLE